MNGRDRNPKDAAALRQAATERLQRFFADLTTRLAAGTAGIWDKVERRLGQQSADGLPPPGGVGPRQQPVQQQQTKAEPEDKK